MVKILKTVDWRDCKNVLLYFAREQLKSPVSLTRPTNFCEFIAAYPLVLHQDMLQKLTQWLQTEPFYDVTLKTLKAENATLFIPDDEADTTILDTVLKRVDAESGVNVLCYLDCQHKSVVQFCQLAGVKYAQIFCENEEESSVAHLVECDGKFQIVPVLFLHNLTIPHIKADMMKSSYLRDYLPRETGDLLSKKSCRLDNNAVPVNPYKSGIDKGDSL